MQRDSQSLFRIWSETLHLKSDLKLSLSEAQAEVREIFHELSLYERKDLCTREKDMVEVILEERINKRTPLSYILRARYFFGLRFEIDQNVLIPRPETEFLVEKALEYLKKYNNSKILEIGTGSGCICVSLAHELKTLRLNAAITATDISSSAIEIAEKNAHTHKVKDLIEFKLANICDGEPTSFDLIISNPPYISTDEYELLGAEIKKEPYEALVGDLNNADGMYFYQKLYEKFRDKRLQTKALLLELDPKRALSTKIIFKEFFEDIHILTDMNAKERFLFASNI